MDKDTKILIADENHIMCVWGLRMNPAYKVTKSTKNILSIRIDEGE